jgi:pimeloyl-ACP methyl ester carboxylesterase
VTRLRLCEPHAERQTPDRYFDSAGVALRYIEAGTGEAMLLLHSFTGNLDHDFVRPGLFAALAERDRTIASDLRGHGKSGKPHDPKKYGLEMALDVVRLLDHLHLARAHIVGYSLGAHIVAQLLSLHPERFITATLGGSPGRRHWSDDDDRRIAIEADELERGVLRTQVLRLWPSAAPPPSEEEIRVRTAKYLEGNDARALAALRRANCEQVISDDALGSAGVPTLGLVGSHDDYLGEFRELAKRCRNLRWWKSTAPHTTRRSCASSSATRCFVA